MELVEILAKLKIEKGSQRRRNHTPYDEQKRSELDYEERVRELRRRREEEEAWYRQSYEENSKVSRKYKIN